MNDIIIKTILESDQPNYQKIKALNPYCQYPHTEIYLSKFISQDSRIEKLKDDVRKLAGVEHPVFIKGDSGTGKQLIAEALHNNSLDSNGTTYDSLRPFVQLNCAGIPETLFESELFGYLKGSYTGATIDRKGLILHAQYGTLFLDEVGDLAMTNQAKLLTALQERKIRRIGSNIEEEVHCRIICASHHDLPKLVEKGLFRLDLYERLSTFELYIPNLLERGLQEVIYITKKLCPDYPEVELLFDRIGGIPLTGNVRSIEKAILRWKVLGK